jgi:hypothetical protein
MRRCATDCVGQAQDGSPAMPAPRTSTVSDPCPAAGRRPTASGRLAHRSVQVDLGVPYARSEGFVVPLNWWARGADRLFPTLDADLEVMPLGPDQVMLTLMGRYEPPLGAVGRGMDRLFLHRVAEACIRGFLHRTAANLELAIAA